MNKKILGFLICIIMVGCTFLMSESVAAKCKDYKNKADECNSATEDGYKCKIDLNKKGYPCVKTKELAEGSTNPDESETNPSTEPETVKDTGKCQSYNAKGKEICESHSEDGYQCVYRSDQKGFQCRKGTKVVEEEQKKKAEKYTSCQDITDSNICKNSWVKVDGQTYAYNCIWRQGACYNGTLDKRIKETVIAGDKEQKDEELKKRKTEGDSKTKASTWNAEDGSTNAFLKKVWGMLKVIVPVLVIVLSIADFLKVLIISDEKNYKEAYTRLLKRIAVGIILFVLPALIKLVLGLAGLQDVGIFEVFS